MRFAVAAVWIVVVSAIAGCSEKSPSWREDVLLSNGTVVRVRRTHRYEVRSAVGGPTIVKPIEYRLEVVASSGKTPPPWVGTLDPLLLDLDPVTGEYVLLCSTSMVDVWKQNGSPKDPPYWEFRLHEGQWQRHELRPIWFGRATNLLPSAEWISNPLSVVTLAKKDQWLREHRIFMSYRSIKADTQLYVD
jgi:hypothetical protein